MNMGEFREATKEVSDEFDLYLADWNEDYAPPLKLENKDVCIDKEDKQLILGLKTVGHR